MSSRMAYVPMKHRKGYITGDQVLCLMNYFIKRAGSASREDWAVSWRNKALFVFVLWRVGRRVSEIIGIPDQPHRCPGLRPIDIDFKNNEIDFFILKKFPVLSKTKKGNRRSEEELKRARHKKAPYVVTLPFNEDLIVLLKNWVSEHDIKPLSRIFPYHRAYVDRFLKEACRELNMVLSGKKKIKNKLSGEIEEVPFQVGAHVFRHGFSINFLSKNNRDPAALVILKDFLVHSNINMTTDYLRFSDNKHRDLLKNASK